MYLMDFSRGGDKFQSCEETESNRRLNLMLRYEFDFPTWQCVIRERMLHHEKNERRK